MISEEEDREETAISDMAIDFWKLLRVSERIMAGLPEERRKRISAQLRFSAGRLDSHLDALGVTLATFEGQNFGPELPAIAVNADEFDNVNALIIESAVEPAVIRNGKVIQNARVMLKESEADVSGN